MGEYAKRNDGAEIKIGTCEMMYYLRYEDRDKVKPMPGNLDPAQRTGMFFRLPFPDEDDVLPGEYNPYNRGYRLGRREDDGTTRGSYWHNFMPEDMADADPGIIQLTHPSGLLLNVPCHHGAKLPEITGATPFWNGKNHHIELAHVKSMPGGKLRPVYHCRYCFSMWSDEWENILPYCGLDKEMLRRLEQYANRGW